MNQPNHPHDVRPFHFKVFNTLVLCLSLTAFPALFPSSGHAALVGRWVADDWAGGTANWVDRVAGKIATVPAPANSPTKTAGVFPQRGPGLTSGLVFNGVDDYLSVAAAQNPVVGKTTVTIVAFFLTTQGATAGPDLYFHNPGPLNGEVAVSPNDWGLTYNSAGNAKGFLSDGIDPSPDVSLIDGRLHTMILTWQDPTVFPGEGVARLYVDGILAGSTVGPQDGGAGIVNAGFVIGANALNLNRFFSGAIGELRFYDSIEEPLALHTEITTYQVVLTTNDSGQGSLRAAVAAAPAGGTVNFARTLSGQTITLTNGQILINKSLTIDASALSGGIAVDGNHAGRIFEMANNTTNVLTALTLTNGLASGDGGAASANSGKLTLNDCRLVGNQATGTGGALSALFTSLIMNRTTVAGNFGNNVSGVYVQDAAATLTGCTFSDNHGAGGDAFRLNAYFAPASLSVVNSTFASNSATSGVGSAITIQQGNGAVATAGFTNCTIAANTVVQAGQPGALAIQTAGGTNYVTLYNTIVSGNTSGGVPSDVTGSLVASNSFDNLIGLGGGLVNGVNGNQVGVDNPQLAPLGNYGGPTLTMLPLFDSPAIDGGTNGTSLTTDQRGFPRVIGPFADIGAVEFQEAGPIVSTIADSGNGSLRFAATYTTNGANLTFAANLSGSTILLTNGQITLNKNLTIDASDLPAGIVINGNHSSRIFEVASSTTNVLTRLTITNGLASHGGGIFSQGTLTLNQSTLAGNSAFGLGGGIENNGTLTLNNCTLFGNSAGVGGGAIDNNGRLILNQCTLFGNSGNGTGDGIWAGGILAATNSTVVGNLGDGITRFDAAPMVIVNSIVAQNAGVNVSGTFTGAPNLITANPLLAPLGNYGGPTQTMPPLAGSSAIDGCTSAPPFTTDQRGFPRIVGPFADIGAVEFRDASPVVTTIANSGNGSLRFAATYTTNGANLTFAANLSGSTILLTNGQITLNKNLTIDASDLPAGVTISGNNASRIFEVASNATVELDSITITGGKSANGAVGATGQDGGASQPGGRGGTGSPGASGGAILNQGTLTLNRGTLTGNIAGNGGQGGAGGPGILQGAGGTGGRGGDGGAIYNSGTGTLTILNSTIVGNASGSGANGGSGTSSGDAGSGGSGGGIGNAGILRLTHTTVTDNAGASRGSGGIGSASHGTGGGVRTTGTLHLTNTIVALNTAPGGQPDLSGSATTIGGVNFIGNPTGATGLGTAGVDYRTGDPMLTPLSNYGGPNHTRSPLDGSPVVDASSSGLATDQRGVARPQGDSFDIGAVEAVWPVDVFGYARSAAPFAFEDISGSGTRVLANADDENFSAPLGFFFSFYGRSYSQVNFTPNGLITFGGTTNFTGNNNLTTTAPTGNFPAIAVLWDDWATLTNGNPGADAVYYQTLGTPGNRRFIVQWNNIFGYSTSPSGVTFQAILFGTNGNILYQYLDVDSGDVRSNGAQATVGIRDTDGHLNGRNSQWSFNEAAITNGQAIVFSPVYVPAGPIELTGLTQLGNGSVQLAFTNFSGALFTVLGSTNVALPFGDWSELGPAVESPPGSGQFQFTDPQAVNHPQRYYRVRSP